MTHQTYLEALRAEEEAAYQKNVARLGDSIVLVEAISATFEIALSEFSAQIETHNFDERTKAVFLMFMNTRYQILGACLSLLRGHIGDSKGFLRKAIELALFALNTLEREAAAGAWSNYANDYEKYLEEFKIRQMLKKDKHPQLGANEARLLESLCDAYDRCCHEVHGTLLSVLRSIDFKADNYSLRQGLALVDPPELFDQQFPMTFFWIIQNAQHVLFFFSHLFRRLVPDFDVTEMVAALDTFNHLFDEHTARLDPQ
jgi:hypothetical protein